MQKLPLLNPLQNSSKQKVPRSRIIKLRGFCLNFDYRDVLFKIMHDVNMTERFVYNKIQKFRFSEIYYFLKRTCFISLVNLGGLPYISTPRR